jgi:hypothetical protein
MRITGKAEFTFGESSPRYHVYLHIQGIASALDLCSQALFPRYQLYFPRYFANGLNQGVRILEKKLLM